MNLLNHLTLSNIKGRNSGFTLIELAIVMVVVSIMIGSMLGPLKQQIDDQKIKETEQQLKEIHDALLGFAAVEGRLPCPTEPGEDGLELDPGTNCEGRTGTVQHGFVPANTLGLQGNTNDQGLLLDAWSQPIRYSISNSNENNAAAGLWDIVREDDIRAGFTANNLLDNNPLIICDRNSPSDIDCTGASRPIVNELPVVFFSTGPRYPIQSNRGNIAMSDAENENLGANLIGIEVPDNNVFADADFSVRRGQEFDDIVMWISPNILYGTLLQAGHLP